MSDNDLILKKVMGLIGRAGLVFAVYALSEHGTLSELPSWMGAAVMLGLALFVTFGGEG